MLKCVIYRSPALALFWAFSRVIPGSPLITKTAVLGRVAAKEPEANAKRKRLNESTHKQRGIGILQISPHGSRSATTLKQFCQFLP